MANDVLLNTTTDLNGKTLVTAEGDRSITGLLTYSRGASAPFAVGSGAANVANLDADKLDGQHAPTGTIVGTTDTQVLTNKTLTTPTEDTPTITNQINLTGGQVKFPAVQVPSANANTLDDYSEGTWTPVLGGSGGTSGQTYAAQTGYYIKIGKLVWATFVISLTAKGTITTNVQVQGFPFTSENSSNNSAAGIVTNFSNLATNWSSLTLIIQANGSAANVQGVSAAATGQTNLATGDVSNTTNMTGTIMYRASA